MLRQLPWYTAIYCIGTEQSGTAIFTRGSLSVTEMEKLRTGRGVPCHYRNTFFVNVFASSVNAYRRDCFHFVDTELLYLHWHAPQNCIVGGDFSCVLSPLDCASEFRSCRTPEDLLKHCSIERHLNHYPV
jgi:hypothetical protein